MKRVIVCTILFMAFFMAPNVADAQLKRLLKEKAIEALKGNKQEESTTQTEEQEQSQPQKPKQTGPNFLERRMMQAMGLNNVKYEPRYSFSSSLVMDIENIDSLQNSDKMLYTTYFDPDSKSYAMVFDEVNKESGQKQQATIIFDMINQSMLILSVENGERSGVAISFAGDSIPENEAALDQLEEEEPIDEVYINPIYQPTGKTKTIAGLPCEEYKYENTEGRVTLWASKKSPIDMSKAYGQMYGMQGLAAAGLGFGNGMIMEMVSEDFYSGAKTIMNVREMLSNTNKSLDVSGYQIVGMSGAGQ
jgi:hypothetical protein